MVDFSRCESQIDANGHEAHFEYDKQGRQIKRILPDGKFETKTYNLYGNLASRTDFMGRTTTYIYDEADRLVSKTYPDATAVSFTYSATGERLSATDARGTTSYSYDQRSRPTLLTYPDGRKLSYTYDAQGNRTSLTAIIGATSLTTSYKYNERNQISTVTDPDGRIFSYSYNENGSPTKLARPNGVETTYSYNGLNRLSALVTKLGASTIASYAYTLGPTGIRTQIDEADGTIRAYGYDSLNRLTMETVTGGAGPNYAKTFNYDSVGNRLRQVTTGSGAADLAYTYDSRDRLLTEGAVSYSWNANGNLVGKAGSDQYEWDFEDRLVKVIKSDGTVVDNTYDVDGVLVRTSTEQPGNIAQVKDLLVDTTGGLSHVVAETVGGTGSLSVFYVRAGDHLLEEIRNGATRFHLTDGLGSVRGLWDEMGVRTDTWDYSAFGETHLHTGSSANPYQFAGERFVGEIGLYQNRARWLDTGIGSFVSGDPARGNTSQPMTHHLYMYGSANPTNYSDPTGKFTYIDVLVATTIVGILSTVAINFVDNYRKYINAAIGVPNPENYPELKAAYSEQEFDKGVARLIRYWWQNEDNHDIYQAGLNAQEFRNLTYGLSQDIRVCAAERYLVGLYGSKPWGQSYPLGLELPYSLGKRIHPWITPGFGKFPPSPYSANAREWYNQGKEGFGGHYGIVPNVDCWRFYVEERGRFFNFAYGPSLGDELTDNINPNCE